MKRLPAIVFLVVLALPRSAPTAETTLVLKSHPAERVAGLEPEVLDFRYQPEQWQTCIGLPDDAFKTIVGRDGGLYYDFGKVGPANYTVGNGRFGTRLLAALISDGPAAALTQRLHSPRVPIVTTTQKQGPLELRQIAWANAPAAGSPEGWSDRRADLAWLTIANTGDSVVPARLRLDVGAIEALRLDAARTRLVTEDNQTFCRFSQPCQPVVQEEQRPHVRSRHPFNTNRNWARPSVPCGGAFRHVLVGNRSPLDFDFPVEKGRKYVVAVGLIEGWHSTPGKRLLELRIEGQTVRRVDLVQEFGRNVPAVLEFPAEDRNADGRLNVAIAPAADADDKNSVVSGVWLFAADAPPERAQVLAGKADKSALALVDADHLPAAPRALALSWDFGPLEPGGKVELLVTVPQGTAAKSATAACDPAAELQRAIAFWEQTALPYGRLEVPDPAVQGLLDSCVRNIYQAREIKDGLPAFQVGPTFYRGLWVVDGAFLLEAVTLLGRAAEARRGIDYLMSFQKPDGGFMLINGHWKETGIVLWAVTHHARLTGDKEWLERMWPKLERGGDYIRQLRRQSIADPQALGAGLMPEGFSDGGLSGPAHEYTNVYWTLVGLRSAAEAARWLGNADRAARWQKDYDDYLATFRRAAARDLRDDGHGHRCLPIVMQAPAGQPPQKAQWAFLHAVYPGQVFRPDDALVRGNMAMLAACEREGLVFDTGWLSEGLWNYFGSFYGHAWLWLGEGRKAAATFYAMGNHASPLLCWREEQRPVGAKPGYVGDMPHNWASAEFIRLACHLLVLERGDELHLLPGVPRSWTRRGAVTRLHDVPTQFGPVSIVLRMSDDGQRATVELTSPRREPPRKIVLHLESFAGDLKTATLNGRPIGVDVVAAASADRLTLVLDFK